MLVQMEELLLIIINVIIVGDNYENGNKEVNISTIEHFL